MVFNSSAIETLQIYRNTFVSVAGLPDDITNDTRFNKLKKFFIKFV